MSQGFVRTTKYDTPTEVIASFGARQVKSVDTVYQADTDGVITCWGSSYSAVIYVSATNPPDSQFVAQYHFTGGSGYAGMSAIVKQGYYWKVTGVSNCTFVPISYS